MESQLQNPEFKINPENFHPWKDGNEKTGISSQTILMQT